MLLSIKYYKESCRGSNHYSSVVKRKLADCVRASWIVTWVYKVDKDSRPNGN